MKTPIRKTTGNNPHSPAISSEKLGMNGASTIADFRQVSSIQRKLKSKISRVSSSSNPIQQKTNKTGLPDKLKSGIENLSGYSMDDVKVHYKSSKPAQLQAHAYAQGTDIHLAPGQEKHLPHEAWHVVQQKQGRVQPTIQLKGKVNINDNSQLEKEADDKGKAAMRMGITKVKTPSTLKTGKILSKVAQRQEDYELINEKLRKVYRKLISIVDVNQDMKAVVDEKLSSTIIYNILGYEEESVYEGKEGDRSLLDKGMYPQNWKKYAKGKDKTRKQRADYNKKAYQRGDYFRIFQSNPENRNIDTRIIINFNNQEATLELLKFIKSGWGRHWGLNKKFGQRIKDWRRFINQGKGYAGEKFENTENTSKEKYDKVVLYYNSEHENEIIEGLKEHIDTENLNEKVSPFYTLIENGIGKAPDPGNPSFTRAMADAIHHYIKFNAVYLSRMREDSFIDLMKRVAMHKKRQL